RMYPSGQSMKEYASWLINEGCTSWLINEGWYLMPSNERMYLMPINEGCTSCNNKDVPSMA
ncbi:hypothetical protein, partial [Solemya velum gill symbiont]|uniref:hypothetical protein n=1 Tax=Solemya velum gill symbiont TaxID=2340 RepID=UPI001F3F778F